MFFWKATLAGKYAFPAIIANFLSLNSMKSFVEAKRIVILSASGQAKLHFSGNRIAVLGDY